MKIHIVCYEDVDSWICGKIAKRLGDAIAKLGHSFSLSKVCDSSADINHHVIYLNYSDPPEGVHTLMVTHIDNAIKLRKLKAGLKTASSGICLSADTVQQLTSLGVDGAKLRFASLGHDGRAKERRFVIGITTRLYPDGRKRESDLLRLLDRISPADFEFRIMGGGWSEVIGTLRVNGFHVEYSQQFEYEPYLDLMAGLDYYLYLGNDEGSMGFIDALAAGVKTIVRPQGYHLDASGGITHAFDSFDELVSVFQSIARDKHARIQSVRNWTWENYARTHIQVWEECLGVRPLATRAVAPLSRAKTMRHWELWFNAMLHRVRMIRNIRKDFDCDSRIWKRRRARERNTK